MGSAPLIIVRFSIQNHRWKAKNLLYPIKLSDVLLQSRNAPLNGRLRYTVDTIQGKLNGPWEKCPQKGVHIGGVSTGRGTTVIQF